MNRYVTASAILAGTALSTVVILSSPAAAATKWWAPSTDPLAAKTAGVVQGRAYGYHEIDYTSAGTRSHAEVRLYDNHPGGQSMYIELHTYVNAGYCVSPDFVQCDAEYYYYDDDESDRWADDSWSAYGWTLGTTAVPASADYARGSVKACEDQNNQPDDCSGWGISKGSSY
jgi:hypothetical protein